MSFSIKEELEKYKIIVAIRGVAPEKIMDTVDALYCGGIRLLEITFNQASPNRIEETTQVISKIVNKYGDKLHVGAGTVISREEVIAAAEAGAKYILSPSYHSDVVRETKRLGLGSVPGAMTPTEVIEAYNDGGDIIKLFPSDNLGLSYIKALKAPVSHVPLLAMGGVNVDNLKEFLQVVEGVGIGSAIVDKKIIDNNDYKGLTLKTQSFTSQL